MDAARLREILSREGLALLDEVGPHYSPADVVRTVARLRAAGHPPTRVAAVLDQAKLRQRARTKFGDFAERMLFTEAGLEQATRLEVAARHAGRFRDAGIDHVADLGCGIGADSLALAGLDIEVDAVERDEVTAAVAGYNLAPFPAATVSLGSAEDAELSKLGGVWLDPARRTGGVRSHDPGNWSPSLEFAFGVARELASGIKLGPGIDRELIPGEFEAQWVSVDGSVVELALYSRELARPGIRRSALVSRGGDWHELTAPADSADVEPRGLGQYLYEPDGAVIRARLIGDLARDLDAGMLDPTIAYLTADAARSTPFASVFRVTEHWPLDAKLVKRELRARGIGRLEVKKRGVDIDPARFRTSLALAGPHEATLVLTRVGGRRTALLGERC